MSKQELHELVERLPDEDLSAAQRFLEFLVRREEPPIDPELLARIDTSRAGNGPTISHEEMLREFGL